MSAKDQIKQIVDYFKREPQLKDKTDGMAEGLLLGAQLANDANELSKETDASFKALQREYTENGNGSQTTAEITVARDGELVLDDRLKRDFGSVNAQLTQMDWGKAGYDYVDQSISTISGGAIKGKYPTLSALKQFYPEGAVGPFQVEEDSNRYIWDVNKLDWVSIGPYEPAEIGDKGISVRNLNDDVTDLIDLGNGGFIEDSYFKYNDSYAYARTAGVSGDFIINVPLSVSGVLKQIKIKANKAGVLNLGIYQKLETVTDGIKVKKLSNTPLTVVNGINDISVSIDLPIKGLYVSVSSPIGYSMTYDYPTLTDGIYDIPANVIVGETAIATNPTSDQAIKFGIGFIVENVTVMRKEINQLKNDIEHSVTKKERPDNGQIIFSVPVNQHIVDPNDRSISVIDNQTELANVPCVAWLPTDYKKNGKKVPLVMMAHGHGEHVSADGSWGSNQEWIGWKNKIVNAGYAVFDVNGYDETINYGSKHWGSPRAIEAYFKAYLWLVENYNVNENLIVSGGSMGGMTALNFANLHSGIVRCVLAYAPCSDFSAQSTNALWEEEYKASYGLESIENVKGYSPIDIKFLNIPLRIWHGTQDAALSYQQSQVLVDTLLINNCPASLRLLEGVGHEVAYANQTTIDESILFMNRFKI